MARGTQLHILLEHLPHVPPKERTSFAERLLTSRSEGAPDLDLIDQAIALLDNAALAHLFMPSALTEVDVTAALPELNSQRIHGAIDRLLVDDQTVLAIDYKSNRAVPKTPEEVPEGLLRQMGAYHAALSQIFPDHRVGIAILWTESATLMPLPATLTANALAQVTDA